jgi:hypothetical protein
VDPSPISFTLLLPFTILLVYYILAYYYLLPLNTRNPLFTANRWDLQPHRKLGQSSWLCCVQVLRCCWWKATCRQVVVWCPCPECRKASGHQPSEVWFFLLLVRLNLGFTTEGNLLLCSSFLPLGVPNWVPNTHYQAFFCRRCRGERRFLQGESLTPNLLLCYCFALLYFCLHRFIKNKKN